MKSESKLLTKPSIFKYKRGTNDHRNEFYRHCDISHDATLELLLRLLSWDTYFTPGMSSMLVSPVQLMSSSWVGNIMKKIVKSKLWNITCWNNLQFGFLCQRNISCAVICYIETSRFEYSLPSGSNKIMNWNNHMNSETITDSIISFNYTIPRGFLSHVWNVRRLETQHPTQMNNHCSALC